ncbi:hypothetical protein V6N13_071487 [Hibiscus sabdariffa]
MRGPGTDLGQTKSWTDPLLSAGSNPVHRSSRWINFDSRYVAHLATVYLLDGGDLHRSFQSPETATADDGD